jgi:CheY-like chemotaxis protein
MINDVLDSARLEAGQLELERAEVDCARLVRQVVELLAPKAFEKGLEIAAVVDPALPDRVLGDEGRLRQILFNLAGAAVRRTDHGGVLVAARLGRGSDEDNARIEFSVTDDGPGFSEDARISMIDPSQLSEDEAVAAENAGLGLVVARRLVGAMGGGLEVETPPGRGACISALLDLPVARPRARKGGDLAGASVIIASGSSVLRRSLREQAQLMGAKAVEAETPGTALHASLASPGSILLVDAGWRSRMKDALAPAAAAGLLLRPDQRALIQEIPALGFDFYLMKPVRMTSLADRVKGRQAEEEYERNTRAGHPRAHRASPVSGARILLAEDNRVNALLASTMLRAEGCIVDIVANGAEAVAAARRAPYDLVLMDVRMPIKNGLEATRDIRALGGVFVDLPIVALTANAFAEDRQACFEAGMSDFATKPIDMEGVADLLHKWTQAKKQAKLA